MSRLSLALFLASGAAAWSPNEVTNLNSFAKLCTNGSVRVWGDADNGGLMPPAAMQAVAAAGGATQVLSTSYAMAAVLKGGSVVTWGDATNGGNSETVAADLVTVEKLYSNRNAFTAVKVDGTGLAWGKASWGGDMSRVKSFLTKVKAVYQRDNYFLAMRDEAESLVEWGGSALNVEKKLTSVGYSDIKKVAGSSSAFAVLLNSGTVSAWGLATKGGDTSSVAAALTAGAPWTDIIGSDSGFAVTNANGAVVTWSSPTSSIDYSTVAASLTADVQFVRSNGGGFAAVKKDQSVVAWGIATYGGDATTVADLAKTRGTTITDIVATRKSFSALLADGSVFSWGDAVQGVTPSGLDKFNPVWKLFTTEYATLALHYSGAVTVWGHPNYATDISGIAAKLSSNVRDILVSEESFTAVYADGTLLSWSGKGPIVKTVSTALGNAPSLAGCDTLPVPVNPLSPAPGSAAPVTAAPTPVPDTATPTSAPTSAPTDAPTTIPETDSPPLPDTPAPAPGSTPAPPVATFSPGTPKTFAPFLESGSLAGPLSVAALCLATFAPVFM